MKKRRDLVADSLKRQGIDPATVKPNNAEVNAICGKRFESDVEGEAKTMTSNRWESDPLYPPITAEDLDRIYQELQEDLNHPKPDIVELTMSPETYERLLAMFNEWGKDDWEEWENQREE